MGFPAYNMKVFSYYRHYKKCPQNGPFWPILETFLIMSLIGEFSRPLVDRKRLTQKVFSGCCLLFDIGEKPIIQVLVLQSIAVRYNHRITTTLVLPVTVCSRK